MSGDVPLDLSGSWHGIYNYPDGSPPVEFEAEIRDSAGILVGSIREVDDYIGLDAVALEATIDGCREGTSVRFTKFYEANDMVEDGEFDIVLYEGEVGDDGHEIQGQWHIPDCWAGTFLMVRARHSAAQADREASETVR